jgi:hypothetical protein
LLPDFGQCHRVKSLLGVGLGLDGRAVGGLLGVIVAVPMEMIKEALEVIRQVTPEETKYGIIKPSL